MNEILIRDTIMEGERELLSGVLSGDASAQRLLITRYSRPLFSYLLGLSGTTRDAAFDKTAEILSARLVAHRKNDSEWFLIECLRDALETAPHLPVRAVFDASGSSDATSPEQMISRRFLKEALERLTVSDKSFLILRDQLCLPYAVIGRVHQLSEHEARVRVEHARLSMREVLEKVLRKKQGLP